MLPVFFVGFPLHAVKAGYISRPYRAAARPARRARRGSGIRRAPVAAAGGARRFNRSAAAGTAR
ncbi:MAG: hypothetical protein ACJ8J3_03715, partial [Burkholderia ambifaria]